MRKFLVVIIIIFLIGTVGIFLAFRGGVQAIPDTVFINDAVVTAFQSEDATEAVVTLTEQLGQAFEDVNAAQRIRDNTLQVFLYVILFTFVALSLALFLYYDRVVLKPFRKLQSFARQIASGNLDIPLEMDKSNLFGAFTESFDLMREELHLAKENERKANQSKKELVASLSHDIKTPVASIKAITELMTVKASNIKDKHHLDTIYAKAEQINVLITNMFHATLEELQAIEVSPVEMQSTEIPNIISNADYSGRVNPFDVPSCLVMADLLRLQQVFDNVISNSYKYADTDISISAMIEGPYLSIDIQDYGMGVPEEELPLLCNKFYRGKNIEKSGGYGLGLFLSKYFMEQMSGELHCENHPDGFVVKILLKLAG
jgi:signal transduction histidine kinase